jgi:hypothetical protein
LPAYLRVVPCGGSAQVQRPDSSEWVAVDTEIAVEGEVSVATEADSDARLCLGDGSVLELTSNSAVEMRPSEDGSRLLVALQDGSVRLLARQRSYGFTTSACPVNVSDAPARIRVERREDATHLMVEEGSAVCATGSDPTLLPTCWELVATSGGEREVAQYCGQAGQLPPTETPTPTSPTPATASPTPEAVPETPSPSMSPEATPLPEATPSPEPTPIP